jgi:hypothetical protein
VYGRNLPADFEDVVLALHIRALTDERSRTKTKYEAELAFAVVSHRSCGAVQTSSMTIRMIAITHTVWRSGKRFCSKMAAASCIRE